MKLGNLIPFGCYKDHATNNKPICGDCIIEHGGFYNKEDKEYYSSFGRVFIKIENPNSWCWNCTRKLDEEIQLQEDYYSAEKSS